MEIYYIILGIAFLITFIGWLCFESGAVFKAIDLMNESVDKKEK